MISPSSIAISLCSIPLYSYLRAFYSPLLAPLRLLDRCSMFGDYVTSIGSFRYRGKTYYADDFCDAGSYGDRKFAIFKWNEEKKRYDLLAEM